MPKQRQNPDRDRKQSGTSREQLQDDREPQRRDGEIQDDQERMEPADPGDTLRHGVRQPDPADTLDEPIADRTDDIRDEEDEDEEDDLR
jgi:hypothetical protein